MVAGCGNNILKYILLFLNFIIFLLALAGVIGSIIFIVKPGILADVGDKLEQLKELNTLLSTSSISAGLYVLLGASVVVLLISFLGCCGAWKEIKCMLGMYATILTIILIAEIAAVVLAFVFKDKIDDGLVEALDKAKKAKPNVYKDVEKIMKCCGVKDKDPCVNSTLTYTTGCATRIKDTFNNYNLIVMVVSISTIVIELLLIIFSCCLCSNVGEKVA